MIEEVSVTYIETASSMTPPSRIVYATLFFLLCFALLMIFKPKYVFDGNNNPRPFGTRKGAAAGTGDGPEPTLLPLGVVVVILAILSLYLFTVIDIATGNTGK